MKKTSPILSFIFTVSVFTITLYIFSCTPKKLHTSGDAKVYNDDSEINMKTTEKKGKMPFDTSATPKINKVQMNLQSE